MLELVHNLFFSLNKRRHKIIPISLPLGSVSLFDKENRAPAVILGIKNSIKKLGFAQMLQELEDYRHWFEEKQ